MKALTVRQPYAGLIAAGVKTIEVRSWVTHYRGPLLIHAGLAPIPPDARDDPLVDRLFRRHSDLFHASGAIIAIVDLVECRPMTRADRRAAWADPEWGDWAWCLTAVRLVRPVRSVGLRGLWAPNAHARRDLFAQGAIHSE
jgi:hypothetical protein